MYAFEIENTANKSVSAQIEIVLKKEPHDINRTA